MPPAKQGQFRRKSPSAMKAVTTALRKVGQASACHGLACADNPHWSPAAEVSFALHFLR
jgi:hypothetical protein